MAGTEFKLSAPIKSGANAGANAVKIEIYCFSNDKLYIFNAKYDLTQFSDNFTVNTNKEQVYGRIDPLVNYSNTQRQISFGITFHEQADDKGKKFASIEGKNLKMLRGLASSLYPRYEELSTNGFNTNVLRSPPLVAININGYVNGLFDPKTIYQESTSDRIPTPSGKMLVGYLDSLSISYDVKSGLVANTNENIQREYSANFSFTPVHDSPGGKFKDGTQLDGWPWPTGRK